jgi:hypothetical protein
MAIYGHVDNAARGSTGLFSGNVTHKLVARVPAKLSCGFSKITACKSEGKNK